MRQQGFSLDDITRHFGLPKTTIYYWIKDVQLSLKAKKRLYNGYIAKLIELNKTKKNFGINSRRLIKKKPKKWNVSLIKIVSHFLFDGEINKAGCKYSSYNKSQIIRLKNLIKKEFGLSPLIRTREDGVIRIEYNYRDLGDYMITKANNLSTYISTASKNKKRAFLQSFFDDEGCVCYSKIEKRRRIRGYQHSKKILILIQNLLKEFSIESKIDKRFTEICISRKTNLIKFQKEINFSPGLYINPNRKNSIWKKKLAKRKILELAINSYLA